MIDGLIRFDGMIIDDYAFKIIFYSALRSTYITFYRCVFQNIKLDKIKIENVDPIIDTITF
jgi:hypothetical protein